MSPMDRRQFLTLVVAAAAAAAAFPAVAGAAGKSAGSPLEVTYYYLPG
jgi:hypothetical protein